MPVQSVNRSDALISLPRNSDDRYLDKSFSNYFLPLLTTPLNFIVPVIQADNFSSKAVTANNFDTIKNQYDGNGEQIVRQAGGKLWQNFSNYYEPINGTPDEKWKNTCAVRLSNAMNKGGNAIPSPSQLPSNIRVLTSDNSGNFIFGASNFANYMRLTNGDPEEVANDLSNIQGRKGVIYFDNYHIDLWDGTTLVGNGDNAANYIESGHPAIFWEAK